MQFRNTSEHTGEESCRPGASDPTVFELPPGVPRSEGRYMARHAGCRSSFPQWPGQVFGCRSSCLFDLDRSRLPGLRGLTRWR
jgi:hypothetical protein